MKIGIFDSGLGGLIVTKGLIDNLGDYDYIYYGDTARVPYGNRSQDTIYKFTKEAVEYLFAQDCKLVILACNTASTEALRRTQKEYLIAKYPDRKVLGVVIPTVEVAVETTKNKKIGVIGTISTINSQSFVREINKLDSEIEVFQNSTPLLVPLIENRGKKWAKPILKEYLKALTNKDIDTLILGCTHYPAYKQMTQEIVGDKIQIISQDELIADKLQNYLKRHPEIEKDLDKNSKREFLVTDLTENIQDLAQELFGKKVNLKLQK
ncbi:glutamate racemase [Patescibacteria group bacterium]